MKTIIKGWVHITTSICDLLRWVTSEYDEPYLHSDYIEEVSRTRKEAEKYHGKNVKKVIITVEFPND